jgi:hypothetical protein
MTQKSKPDFDVFVSQENGDKNWYTNIGAALYVAKDGISIKLKALPMDGNLVLFPHKNGND